MHYHIVGLEGVHIPYPNVVVSEPNTTKLTTYLTTSPAELGERVKDATIIITSTVKITAEVLSEKCAPNLLAIASMSAGTDHIDLKAAKARGIAVFNCPNASGEVVANHAIGLYFAARRRTVLMHNLTVQEPSEWKEKSSIVRYMRNGVGEMPLVVAEEVCGIVGFGAIGKYVETFTKALGMQVLVSGRPSGANTSPPAIKPGRVPFTDVLKRSTVLFVAAPKTEETVNLISEAELNTMNPHAVIVNIARGGIVNEAAIVAALRKGTIAGYATDVFEIEPAEGAKDSPLLASDVRDLNLTLSPHAAWYGERTRQNLISILKDNIEKFIAGTPQNLVV